MAGSNFESIGDSEAFDKLSELKNTGKTCDKHDVQMVKHGDKEPFCLICTQERIQEHESLLVHKANKREQEKDKRWLSERSILSDTSIRKARFDNFDARSDEEIRNKKEARYMANDFRHGDYYNVVMSGTAGAGKSHLAMSMLQAVNEFSEEPKKCLFVSAGELIRKIQDSFDNDESPFRQDRTIAMLHEPDVLVIDDLGAESGAIRSKKSASDFVNRTLVAVMNGRLEKATITTTNLSSKELSNLYDPRLLSRLYTGISKEKGLLTFNNTTDKRFSIQF